MVRFRANADALGAINFGGGSSLGSFKLVNVYSICVVCTCGYIGDLRGITVFITNLDVVAIVGDLRTIVELYAVDVDVFIQAVSEYIFSLV